MSAGVRSPSARYVPVALLARGGMGSVELAYREEGRFFRLYAVKRPTPERRGDPTFRSMLLEEARIAGLVRHANVVSVIDCGEDELGPFLVMEFVEGVAASELVQAARAEDALVPAVVALSVCAQAAAGLHAAHELVAPDGSALCLIHRDVHPRNVLVGFDGVVRVTDFGIAKANGNEIRTKTGILKGNLGYIAPEQLRFEEPDRRSDLFSLGVVLYELLAGERLYPGDSVNQTAQRILHEPPPDIGELRPGLPPELCALLFELLAKDPNERPATAREVARRLEQILALVEEEAGALDLPSYLQARFGAERERRALEVRRAVRTARAQSLAASSGAAPEAADTQSVPAPIPPLRGGGRPWLLFGLAGALAISVPALAVLLREAPSTTNDPPTPTAGGAAVASAAGAQAPPETPRAAPAESVEAMAQRQAVEPARARAGSPRSVRRAPPPQAAPSMAATRSAGTQERAKGSEIDVPILQTWK